MSNQIFVVILWFTLMHLTSYFFPRTFSTHFAYQFINRLIDFCPESADCDFLHTHFNFLHSDVPQTFKHWQPNTWNSLENL